MIFNLTALLILAIVSGLLNGSLKTILHFWEGSIFEERWPKYFFTPHSYLNKYKNRTPKDGARFFGATTFLKWVTCGYRLFTALRIATLMASIYIALALNISTAGVLIVGTAFAFFFFTADRLAEVLTAHKY